MQHVDEVLELLDLDQLDEDVFSGDHPETMLQRSFGGQVMAQALAAVYRTLPDERLAHGLTGYFLRPGRTDAPIAYHVQRTRDGGTFSNRRVEALQGDRTIFVMSASFKQAEQGLEHTAPPMAEPPEPESCPRLSEVLGRRSSVGAEAWEREWGALETRFGGLNRVDGGHLQVWLRSNGPLPEDPRVHQMLLAYASDLTLLAVSTVAHPDAFGRGDLQLATIDHSMWFHRHIRADEWVLYDQSSPVAVNALGLSLGRLYSVDGVLGASAAQEGLVRLPDGRSRQPQA